MDAHGTTGTGTPGTPPPRQMLKRDKCDEPVQKKSRSNPAWWPALRPKKLGFKSAVGGEGGGEGEGDTVRLEITAVHKAYMAMIKEKDDEIEALKKNMMTLSKHFAIDMDNLQSEHESLCDDLNTTEEELGIIQSTQKEWIGRTLKMKFILDEIKKVGALPEDHADWVFPMVDDITIPDVSINIRDEFVPTAQTDNIDWSDEDMSDATIGFTDDEDDEDVLSTVSLRDVLLRDTLEMVATGNVTRAFMDGTIFIVTLDFPRAILERNATRIQRAWREHRQRECVEGIRIRTLAVSRILERNATRIQRAWRDYRRSECVARPRRIRTIAASKIQRTWREHCHDKMLARFSVINMHGLGVTPIHFDFNYI
jgi:hypothetical protein